MKQKKLYTQTEVDEYVRDLMTKSEIALSHQAERLEKELKEKEQLSRELEELKQKEKTIARLLILSERKTKFIEQNTRSRCTIEIERLARLAKRWDEFFSRLDSTYNTDDKNQLEQFKNEISQTIDTMLDMENMLGETPLSEAEKAHEREINRLDIIKDKRKNELDARFSRLVTEFNMKIGDNATRKRGRPRKETATNIKAIEKSLNEPRRRGKNTTTVYPPVGESGFDFEEALNPTDSLEDIMRDLLGTDIDI